MSTIEARSSGWLFPYIKGGSRGFQTSLQLENSKQSNGSFRQKKFDTAYFGGDCSGYLPAAEVSRGINDALLFIPASLTNTGVICHGERIAPANVENTCHGSPSLDPLPPRGYPGRGQESIFWVILPIFRHHRKTILNYPD